MVVNRTVILIFKFYVDRTWSLELMLLNFEYVQ